jgi:A/G-specific adenine glycosylase
MLQQTRAAFVERYYDRFLQRFPAPQALAEASEEEAMAYWEGLGYYRRLESLVKAARQVAAHGMPTRYEELRLMPGFGEYTAAAVASIAFGERVPAIDGNVARVVARLACLEVGGSALLRRARHLSKEWMGVRADPGEWNQALMELGATVCLPRAPRCENCPLESLCLARAVGCQEQLPPRERKPMVDLVHAVVCAVSDGMVGVRRITEGRWWRGMYEFPRVEVPPQEDAKQVLESEGWTKLEALCEVRHVVTRHRITLKAFVTSSPRHTKRLLLATREDLERLPMPAPQRRVAEALVERYFR